MNEPIRNSRLRRCVQVAFIAAFMAVSAVAGLGADVQRQVMIRDITQIEGIRENSLVGYGIVVGLHGTGDSQQTYFTAQTLANAMQRMGVLTNPSIIRVANVAAVFVTASLPPFATPGTKLDVTVASVGDAKSLEGGVLLLTSLYAPDGQVYADAQGPLTLGGYIVRTNGNSKMVNHTTVGRIPEGGVVERDTSVDLSRMTMVSFTLRDPDFAVSRDIAEAINQSYGKTVATAVDSRRIDVNVTQVGGPVPILISRVQGLKVVVHPAAKVVVNERTGTIVMGGDVQLSAVSILHGDLSIEVATKFKVSQPNPFGTGTTTTVPETTVTATDSPARSIKLDEGASVEDLINGLHAIGATARDIVAILQAIKSAGGLQADLEVL